MGSHSYSGKRKFNQVKAHWTPANHEVFIDLCLEQISAGNKPGAHFTIQGWRNILESFQSITGLEYDRIQLKNHWDLTKRQWKVWHDLVSNERLKWDPCTRRFGASDQEWNEILKVYRLFTLCICQIYQLAAVWTLLMMWKGSWGLRHAFRGGRK